SCVLSPASYFFLSPLLLRPLRSTLFPYTTLFRSEAALQFSAMTGGSDGLWGIQMWPVLGLFGFDLAGRTAFAYSFIVVLCLFLLDRKSTRLNSSHVKISYAVFCLKKKKNKATCT